MITERITHNLLVCDPISYPILYELPRRYSDLEISQIILAGFMGVLIFIFTQYGFSMGIRLNLDITGAPAPDSLTFDLSFPRGLFLVMFDSSGSVTRASESLAA